jgi:hypothetical protein
VNSDDTEYEALSVNERDSLNSCDEEKLAESDKLTLSENNCDSLNSLDHENDPLPVKS